MSPIYKKPGTGGPAVQLPKKPVTGGPMPKVKQPGVIQPIKPIKGNQSNKDLLAKAYANKNK